MLRQLVMMGNFEDAVVIASVFFGSAAVKRLRERGEVELKESSLRHLNDVRSLFESGGNYESSLASHSSESTTLPVLALLLLELEHSVLPLDDAIDENKLINFHKRRAAFAILKSTPWIRQHSKSSMKVFLFSVFLFSSSFYSWFRSEFLS